MTRLLFGLGISIVLILSTITMATRSPGFLASKDDRTEMWKKVDAALEKGLPKTAIEQLQLITQSAKQDQAFDEAIRAVCRIYQLTASLENDQAVAIKRFMSELDGQPPEMQPLMKTILANWFWAYYQQNRWQFMQRTQTQSPPGDDFETWDLKRILDEADRLFQSALQNEESLKKRPVGEFSGLLEAGNVPDRYRPTLYDFIAQNAVDFYSLAEQRTRPEGAFELTADSSVFGTIEDFLNWKLDTQDPSPTAKALRLLQNLLAFHASDDDPSARLSINLQRLNFGHNEAVGPEMDARYTAALERFIQDNSGHEYSSAAAADWADFLRSENKMVQAREICLQAIKRFPQGNLANRCRNIVTQIEAPEANVNTERVWNAPWPTIDVSYRNVNKIYFRLVPFDFAAWASTGNWSPESFNEDPKKVLLQARAIREWSNDLPPTTDYLTRSANLPLPDDLPSGSFYLIASFKNDFSENDNLLSFCEVWVSKLAIVERNANERRVEGFVLNATSGEPIENVQVQVWAVGQRQRRETFERVATLRTNQDGLYQVNLENGRRYLVYATWQGQSLTSADSGYANEGRRNYDSRDLSVLFTDRAIYRPGQTIQFKGILIHRNLQNDDYHTLPGRSVEVGLFDSNNQQLETLKLQSNSAGSVSGSFTAPRDRGTGLMTLRVTNGPDGAQSVRVEEYKRPKFYVELKSPKESPRLEEKVQVGGLATSYTSAPIDGAQVRYRVVRSVSLPPWWYWRCWWWPINTESLEIAHGTTQTNLDGSFEIEFTAVPDRSVPKISQPTFQYQIYADVIDSTGETRSQQFGVNVGYTALSATVSADDWQTTGQPVSLKIATSSLDGEPISTSTRLRIYQLQSPDRVHRARLSQRWYYFQPPANAANEPLPDAPPDWSDIKTWPNGKEVFSRESTTDGEGKTVVPVELAAGAYRAVVESNDRFGNPVSSECIVQVIDLSAKRPSIKLADIWITEKTSVEVGKDFVGVWGTGYESGRAYVEVEHRGKIIAAYWTDRDVTQNVVRVPITESMRGGIVVYVTHVQENRAYLTTHRVDVPWSNKQLSLKWDHFVDKLKPGGKETWSLVIDGPDAMKSATEVVAAMYDASLDAFVPHNWPNSFNVFRQEYPQFSYRFDNQLKNLNVFHWGWQRTYLDQSWIYRHFFSDVAVMPTETARFRGRALGGFGGGGIDAPASAADGVAEGASVDSLQMFSATRESNALAKSASNLGAIVKQGGEKSVESGPDLANVSARTNLNETAFFYPQLTADESGVVRIEFTVPEALTEWRVMSFAHDSQLRAGLLTGKTVTAKDLMVQPNPPRFLREGDIVEFTVKVTNQSPTVQSGTARLNLMDAATDQSVDAEFGIQQVDQSFEIPAGQSKSLAWRISVPDRARILTYKAVAATDQLSDGEQGFLPVILRRVLVKEAMALPIRGNQTREFEFERLKQAANSDSLQNESLTVQVTSNPAWYAVMSLPYLMEFPYECCEQTFNRLYANALARHIANADPKIRRIFDQWRGTDALESPLTKNEDLKSLLIQETPWLLEAKQESQARRNVGILFDQNRLDQEIRAALQKLTQAQYVDGSWPWFPGGRSNEFITLYIATGFGRLRHLGVDVDVEPALKSLEQLDQWIDENYRRILQSPNPENNHLTPTICFYLYGRSFFLNDRPIDPKYQPAIDYFLGQAKKYWVELHDRLPQGYLAISLQRMGDRQTPKEIVASLKERSLSSEELGMYWREDAQSWWWYRAPIETQALMIEVFDEVAADQAAVQELQIWLLKQKQTQDWKTTKATADAVYALLRRGTNWLAADKLVSITLGSTEIQPDAVEAGTGYYRKRFDSQEVRPELAEIKMVNPNPNIAWGSVHWQYLEDMSKVSAYEGTPLTLKKSLYTKQNTAQGPTLVAVAGPLAVGDELVVRLELRVDRDMEFVHLKDYRGSGTEPVDVLSQYRFQDGLAYYQSTRDTATHFFIDYLPQGTYVFEYSTRVQLRGDYQTGFAEIQCMYAPEFGGHSESLSLKVQ